ncbi:MAG: hypothetical protein OJF50_002505 [Nitrospira sp.]|nr:hypothetical protein [Nitrospira sp.]
MNKKRRFRLRNTVSLLKKEERDLGFDLKRRMRLREAQLALSETKHERMVGQFLRQMGIVCERQKGFIVDGQIYVVDFCFGNTIIEIDGSTHVKHEQAVKDAIRDASFQELGYRVFRITNQEVDDMTAAQLEHFLRSCVQRTNDTELEGAPS